MHFKQKDRIHIHVPACEQIPSQQTQETQPQSVAIQHLTNAPHRSAGNKNYKRTYIHIDDIDMHVCV